MGVAVAEAALDRGARVTMIAANVEVPLPLAAAVIRVESTADMRAGLLRSLHASDASARFDALVMAAAVADFRPTERADTKLARGDALVLRLESTPDLLAEVARIVHGLDADGAPTRAPLRPAPFLVGFAAETGRSPAHPRSSDASASTSRRQRCRGAGSGFGTDTNRVSISPPTVTRGPPAPVEAGCVGNDCSESPPRWTRDARRADSATTEPTRDPA
jgi:phosphopantothenoylcysteine decarboxylase/phosphopantothenate--cysteine ligase